MTQAESGKQRVESEKRTDGMTATESALPTAVSRPSSPWARWLWWLLPALALVTVLIMAAGNREGRGPLITISFADGNGLAPGDELRHRGIAVGVVEAVTLSRDLAKVDVQVRLQARAAALAQSGSQFWIPEPEISLTGVQGVGALLGGRWLEVEPGDGPATRAFVGLDQSPVTADLAPGGLELILRADDRSGLTAGAPVSYRRCIIGRVLAVGLASDATAVEVRVQIEPAYAGLVRTNSVFWTSSGIAFDSGFLGIGAALEVASLTEAIEGGVAVATPQQPGDRVSAGRRFVLHAEVDEEWLDWRPALPVGSDLLPDGLPLPAPERIELAWQETGLFGGYQQRPSWGLVLAMANDQRSLLAPADRLLPPDDDVEAGSAVIRLAGNDVAVAPAAVTVDGLAQRPLAMQVAGDRVWPAARLRAPDAPEDLVLVDDPLAEPLPVAAATLTHTEAGWQLPWRRVEPDQWHGAVAVAREDGAVIGMVVVVDRQAWVVPLAPALLQIAP